MEMTKKCLDKDCKWNLEPGYCENPEKQGIDDVDCCEPE